MTKSRKVELLYCIAKGRPTNATPAELKELRKYRVDCNELSGISTKKAIAGYVDACDNGYRSSFYDWCITNGIADRRIKGNSEGSIKGRDKNNTITVMILGALGWGVGLGLMTNYSLNFFVSAIIGAVLSRILYRFSRRAYIITSLFLPICLGVIVRYVFFQ